MPRMAQGLPWLGSAAAGHPSARACLLPSRIRLEPTPRRGWRRASAGILLAAALASASGAGAQQRPSDPSPGFGIVIGQGLTANDTIARRFGFTSRRLQDGDRLGSLALLYEEHYNGIGYRLYDDSVDKKDVSLHFQSLYLELKRYFPFGGLFHLYWGLRGGYTRVEGTIERGKGEKDETFREDSVGPLWFLALPFVLEHPGFLLLGGVDGTSAGITLDLMPDHVWLDLGLGTVILPEHRDRMLAFKSRFVATGMLQLVVVF